MYRVLPALALAGVLTAVVAGCSAAPGSAPAHRKPPVSYYLALGDSLAVGVQPDAAGTSVETRSGYADQLYATLRRSRPGLRLVKLGCPGETTVTMMKGGICAYSGGSQLAAAVSFLHAHRARVSLVTIDIGANDADGCVTRLSFGNLASCLSKSIPQVTTNLTKILTRLRQADPKAHIIAMSYYLPALAQWRNGPVGKAVARVSEMAIAGYNVAAEPRLHDIPRPGGRRVRRLPHRRLRPAGGRAPVRHTAAQRRRDLPVDLGVRGTSARAERARQPGRLPGDSPRVPERRRVGSKAPAVAENCRGLRAGKARRSSIGV